MMEDHIRVSISGFIPATEDVNELKDFIFSLKNFGKDVLAASPDAGVKITLSYEDADGELVEIPVWEQRPA